MRVRIRCRYCGCLFYPDPRCKNPKACRNSVCQRRRKYASDKQWRESDPEVLEDRRLATRVWLVAHPGYLKRYRVLHPASVEQNRKKQRERRNRARVDISTSKLAHPANNQKELFELLPIGEGVDISTPIFVQRIEIQGVFSHSP